MATGPPGRALCLAAVREEEFNGGEEMARPELGHGRVPAGSQFISVCQSECVFLFVFFPISCPLKMRNITLFNDVSHVQAHCLKHSKHSINVYCVNEDMCV